MFLSHCHLDRFNIINLRVHTCRAFFLFFKNMRNSFLILLIINIHKFLYMYSDRKRRIGTLW